MTGIKFVVGVLGGLLGVAVASLEFSTHPIGALMLLFISGHFCIRMWRHHRTEILDVVGGVVIALATADQFWSNWPWSL